MGTDINLFLEIQPETGPWRCLWTSNLLSLTPQHKKYHEGRDKLTPRNYALFNALSGVRYLDSDPDTGVMHAGMPNDLSIPVTTYLEHNQHYHDHSWMALEDLFETSVQTIDTSERTIRRNSELRDFQQNLKAFLTVLIGRKSKIQGLLPFIPEDYTTLPIACSAHEQMALNAAWDVIQEKTQHNPSQVLPDMPIRLIAAYSS